MNSPTTAERQTSARDAEHQEQRPQRDPGPEGDPTDPSCCRRRAAPIPAAPGSCRGSSARGAASPARCAVERSATTAGADETSARPLRSRTRGAFRRSGKSVGQRTSASMGAAGRPSRRATPGSDGIATGTLEGMAPSPDDDLDWLYGRDDRRPSEPEPTRVLPPDVLGAGRPAPPGGQAPYGPSPTPQQPYGQAPQQPYGQAPQQPYGQAAYGQPVRPQPAPPPQGPPGSRPAVRRAHPPVAGRRSRPSGSVPYAESSPCWPRSSRRCWCG